MFSNSLIESKGREALNAYGAHTKSLNRPKDLTDRSNITTVSPSDAPPSIEVDGHKSIDLCQRGQFQQAMELSCNSSSAARLKEDGPKGPRPTATRLRS